MIFYRINLIFIPDNIESEADRIFSRDKKLSPFLASDFENFIHKWQILLRIFKFSKSEPREELHFGLHFLSLLKIQFGSLSILSRIKNYIDSIKIHFISNNEVP